MDTKKGNIKRDLCEDLKQLVIITSHKKKRLKSLLNMTKMQSQAIEQQDIDLLTSYIQEKQRHIDAIDELDAQFTEIYSNEIKEGLAQKTFIHRSPEIGQLFAELKSLISSVQDIIKAIYSLEQSNSQKAKEVMETLKKKIRHIQTGKKGYNAYTQSHEISDGIYIDQKK